MTYQLEKITEADRQKIITDCIDDKYLNNLIKIIINGNRFPEVWAIDKRQDNYLFAEPGIGIPEIDGRPYIFFYEKTPYRIASERASGNKFYFRENYEISIDRMKNIQEQTALAFGVFGRYGMGELNRLGKPEFRVVPQFMNNL